MAAFPSVGSSNAEWGGVSDSGYQGRVSHQSYLPLLGYKVPSTVLVGGRD